MSTEMKGLETHTSDARGGKSSNERSDRLWEVTRGDCEVGSGKFEAAMSVWFPPVVDPVRGRAGPGAPM